MNRHLPFKVFSCCLAALAVAGCLPPLENEIDWSEWSDSVIDRLRQSETVECTSHPAYMSANPDLPYDVTEQLIMAGVGSTCSDQTGHVTGTDLGISVHFDGLRDDLIYFGDTNAPPTKALKQGPEFFLRYDCAYKSAPLCNDAYGTIRDDDPTDGVDMQIQATSWAHLNRRDKIAKWTNGFASIRLMGLDMRDLDDNLMSAEDGGDIFGDFNTPSGAMAITGYQGNSASNVFFEYGKMSLAGDSSQWEASPGVMLFFATASNIYDKKQAWLGCSLDGVVFRSCTTPRENAVTLFSRDKFIQAAPIPFTRDDVDETCAAYPDSVYCGLDTVLDDYRPDFGQGALIFGNGKYYRCSPLYLAYLELPSGDVWYFGGAGESEWSRSEADARAIVQPDVPGYNPSDPDSCPKFSAYDTLDASPYLFGELSVKLIDGYFVMLSNHVNLEGDKGFVRIYYRTAPLSSPASWSEPEATEGIGYGPYILGKYTAIVEGDAGSTLQIYHALSTWNPSFNPEEPYAVMTKELRLKRTGEPPPWPPENP